MSVITNAIIFLEVVAFFLFGTAFLLQRKLVQPIERIRLAQGTFWAIIITVLIVFMPIFPQTKVAVLPKTITAPEPASSVVTPVTVTASESFDPHKNNVFEVTVSSNQTKETNFSRSEIAVPTLTVSTQLNPETAAKPATFFR
ncbi:MAG: hypothetical protein ACRC2T_06375 [Thermoguttaceae bacterium]